ncbi:MAG: sigma-70 family RNA polymerase sigma factor [Bacteroidales bacterium]|nr:sigma-70 family RNA polymerase sigma factor [Bacteroidales bacterium]
MQLFGDNSHLNTWTIEKAKEGDRRAQKAIYDALSAKMFPVCLRYMGEREAAEDILQDGFVTLFSKLDSFSGEGSFEGWARKIFVNTALMSLRKNDVLKESDDVEEARSLSTEAPSAVQDLGYKELCKMISELPAGFRTVFNLFVVEGYSHADIAEALGISEGTSRSQLNRARAMLQARILETRKK